MPRTCTVCTHPSREAIDRALVAGEAYRSIAQRFAASPDAVLRHKEHLPQALAQAKDAAAEAHGDDLLQQVKDLQKLTMGMLAKAYNAGDLRTALQAVGQARQNLELIGKLVGELQQEGTINLVVSPEWVQIRGAVLVALAPYPEARVAVSERLVALEGGASRVG